MPTPFARVRSAVWLTLLLVCPVFGAGAVEPETVKVGVCLSFTGEFAPYGRINLAGMNLFIDDFNSRAAENGFRFELVVRDDASDPEKAAGIARELVQDHGVSVIVGAVTSNITFKLIEQAEELGVVVISPGASNPRIGVDDDWAFKVLPADDAQGVALAKFFANQMGCRTAAVVMNDFFVYGAETLVAFKEVFEREGGRIVADERYVRDSGSEEAYDFSEIVERLRRADPEVVLIASYVEDAIRLIDLTEETDWRPLFCGGDSWLNTQVIYAAGDVLDDSYYVGGADVYTSGTPEAKRFARLLDASSEPGIDVYSVNGFDVMALIAHAMMGGARSAWDIRANLRSLANFPLAAGKISFDARRGAVKTVYIYRIGKMNDGFFSEVVAEVEPF